MAVPPSHVDFQFKTIVIGESSSGKSSLLASFITGKPSAPISRHTVGVEFASRTIAVSSGSDANASSGDGKVVKLQIWDTAGQDRFRSITRSYYRGAVACLILFALNDRSSFEKLPNWLKDARTYAGNEVTIVLVGNKADLTEERQVTLLEASKYAQSEGCPYIETSAKTGDNVEAAFFKLARCVLTKTEDGTLDPTALSGSNTGTTAVAVQPAAPTGGCSC